MAEGIESGIGGVWQTPQSTAGTIERPDATTMVRLRKAGDDALRASKAYGAEEYVDGRQWGSPTSYVESIGGEVGTLTVQGQVAIAAFLWAQLLGSDVVTGAADPWTHTITSGTDVPVSQTIYQAAGSDVGPVRHAFYDAKISRLTWSAGQDQKVVHVAEDIVALNAAEWFDTPPTARDVGEDPATWMQATTRVGGVALPEIRSETVEADAGVSVHRGQTAAPIAWIYGKGQLVRTVESIVTDGTLPHVLRALHGTATPTDGDAVTNEVAYAALASDYVAVAARRELRIDTPRVEVRPDDWMLGPRAEGGEMPVAFGGRCFEDGGSPMITVTALTGDELAYV